MTKMTLILTLQTFFRWHLQTNQVISSKAFPAKSNQSIFLLELSQLFTQHYFCQKSGKSKENPLKLMIGNETSIKQRIGPSFQYFLIRKIHAAHLLIFQNILIFLLKVKKTLSEALRFILRATLVIELGICFVLRTGNYKIRIHLIHNFQSLVEIL